MSAKIEFFPVDNGDMTLITLESGRRILIDVRVCEDLEEGEKSVIEMLRDRLDLDRDEHNRLYVDVFLLTHPDQDHTLGLSKYFHLGPISTWKEDEDKIIIKEMWSSPIIFRRKVKTSITLCDDAKQWSIEARRRVQAFRDGHGAEDGNRILVMGEDIADKTEGLDAIRIPAGEVFNRINGDQDDSFTADLIGPSTIHDEDIEDALAKNRSSVVCRFNIKSNSNDFFFLCGGDAEVLVWERLWHKYQATPTVLEYDLLQTPHHCSLHSLTVDSWTEKRNAIVINEDARKALSQARHGATIVASCKPIENDDNDPPSFRASQEYQATANSVDGDFINTMTHTPGKREVLIIPIGSDGSGSGSSSTNRPLGPTTTRLDPPSREFEKTNDGNRYA